MGTPYYNWETDEPGDEDEFSFLDYVKSGGILDYVKSGGMIYLVGILCFAVVQIISALGQKIGVVK